MSDKRDIILDFHSSPDAILNALHQGGWAVIERAEVERLRAENEQLRAALERIANETGIFHPQRIAREALSATQGGDE